MTLPKKYHEKSLILLLLGLGLTFSYWGLATWAVYSLWNSSLPLLLKIGALLPLGVIGGYGILLTGFIGHDGTHFTLDDNKTVSSAIGILVTSVVTPYLLMGFTISHWNHHKFTNTLQDPDAVLFGKFKSFWSRLLLARSYTFFEYGRTAFKLAFGIPLEAPYTFPLEKKTIQRLAQFNILSNLVSLSIQISIAVYYPSLFLSFLYILGWGALLSGLSPYIEHTGTGLGRGNDTRTSTGWWWDIFLLGNNYHLEHHLYPTVPFYRLKSVYLFLKSEGYYDSPRFTSNGLFDTYRYVQKKYPYPKLNPVSSALWGDCALT